MIVTSPDKSPYNVYAGNYKPPARTVEFPHTQPVQMAVFDANNQQVATASDDGLVRLFDISGEANEEGEIEPLRKYSVGYRAEMPTISAAVTSVDFSPDGTQLLGSSNEGKAWIWNLDGEGENIVIDSGVIDGSTQRNEQRRIQSRVRPPGVTNSDCITGRCGPAVAVSME